MRQLIYKSDGAIIRSLIQKDPQLAELFKEPREVKVNLIDASFAALAEAIVAQQLSGRVAEVIWGRVVNLLNKNIIPSEVVLAKFDDLRKCGLSARKAEYIQSLASKVISGEVHFNIIENMSNQEVIDMLVKVKGIGPWTAEMFLMFSLGREDVFSVLDLGLRNGLQKLYKREMTYQEMIDASLNWAPYRSVVSHYLWRYNAR